MEKTATASAFIPLPVRTAAGLRVLGPEPAAAATQVEPLTPVDEPVGLIQGFLAAVCDDAGRMMEPCELLLAVDPARLAPGAAVAPLDVLEALQAREGGNLRTESHVDGGPSASIPSGAVLAPLLYCRKRHVVFEARDPATCKPLSGAPVPAPSQLILDQGAVAHRAQELQAVDPRAFAALAAEHTCCTCEERKRCYPESGGYAYAVDRLVLVHFAETPLRVDAFGEWRLDEAAALIGGVDPGVAAAQPSRIAAVLDEYRVRVGARMSAFGPPRLLSGETDGRELMEVARLRLSLVAGALEQLLECWESGRPHLCWNDTTVRAGWRAPGVAPGACWGLRPILRKSRLAPPARVDVGDARPLPAPPEFSDPDLLPPEVVHAARCFGQAQRGSVFVKSIEARGAGAFVRVLLEDTRLTWAQLAPSDVVLVQGGAWSARLSPAARRDPDDGAGLAFEGSADGDVSTLRARSEAGAADVRWFPRFGEAVDLLALGRLGLEVLLATDERPAARVRSVLGEELEALARACTSVPLEQRDEAAGAWIALRCDEDHPASLWSRRNLLHRRSDRAATRLDGFPAPLWHAVVAWYLRLATLLEGFSFCRSRADAAARDADGSSLVLLELRGLMALLDDHLFGRSAAVDRLRGSLFEAKGLKS